tara:strand:- start:13 stop:876 length:864 start_codon:yes stop_codon:yes gene_type:complete
MGTNNKIKHVKIKNTGLIFEFLLRQVTADVLDKRDNSKTVNILKKRFNENTELGKELTLYNTLVNTKFKSDKKANFLVEEVLKQRRTLNNSQLKREKYNLIKQLKEQFDLNNFMSSTVKNYKTYASIYKLFEYENGMSAHDKTETHFNLVEYITTSKKTKLTSTVNSQYTNDEDLRILSYRILLEKFNKKYSNLNYKQKSLLKAYINNISNTNLLKEYIEGETKKLKKVLTKNSTVVKDKVVRIKLNEAINSIDQFCNIDNKKTVQDSAVVQLMRYYELAKQLKIHG